MTAAQPGARRPRRRGRPLDALVAGLDARRLAHADAGRRLGRRHPGRPPRLDRRGGACSPPPTRSAWDALVLEAIADPTASSTAQALDGGAAPIPDLLGRWRRPRSRARAALRARAGRAADAVVRPADVADLDGDRAADGDLGAQPATCTRRSASRREPTDRIRHVAHLGVRTRDFAFASPRPGRTGRGVPRRARRAVRRAWTLGPGGRRPDADRPAPRLLPAGHPARPPRRHRPVATGADADRWLDIAQAFAGPPGEGRPPRAETRRGRRTPDRQLLRLLRRPPLARCARCSTAARSTSSPATTSPS